MKKLAQIEAQFSQAEADGRIMWMGTIPFIYPGGKPLGIWQVQLLGLCIGIYSLVWGAMTGMDGSHVPPISFALRDRMSEFVHRDLSGQWQATRVPFKRTFHLNHHYGCGWCDA